MDREFFPRTPLLNGDSVELTRSRLLDYFHATFDRYESLFETLSCDEAFYKKPISLRHPLIFYYGHTATFFVNKLMLAGLLEKRLNPRFESLFAVGVDEMGWDDLDETRYDWPAVSEVTAYRDKVRELIDSLIRKFPLPPPINWKHPGWVVPMGIEHERIHLETSSVLIRQHDLKYVRPHADWTPCRSSGIAPVNGLVDIPSGAVVFAKSHDDPYYGWDNEYGTHSAEIEGFQASRFLVSNAEFLSFVEEGGYADDRYWQEEGLGWRNFAQSRHPSFWVKDGGKWRLRLMLEEVDMPWDWPVETNYHEAKAFCEWKKARTGEPVRLPIEDEWQHLHQLAGIGEALEGSALAANLHLDHYASSCPVNQFPHGDLFDVVGNVWQWTETPIYPFAGFDVHPCYDDFSTPTFDNRHNLIKGGSWISCGNEALSRSRYAFRRHFFQHAGFRYVVGGIPADVSYTPYETDRCLAEVAEFHYGEEYLGVANFPKGLAELALRAASGKPHRKALDLGCGAGRASFELARHFDHVTGVDTSARLIGLGTQCLEGGVLRYTLVDEGELVFYKERSVAADLSLASLHGTVEFWQADPCNLKPGFAAYDLILAGNLLERLYNPAKCLESIHDRLNPGGLLVLSSTYAWNPEVTKREEWLGGFKRAAESFTSLEGLKQHLASGFRLIQGPLDIPYVLREDRRRFGYHLAEVTVWERLP